MYAQAMACKLMDFDTCQSFLAVDEATVIDGLSLLHRLSCTYLRDITCCGRGGGRLSQMCSKHLAFFNGHVPARPVF
jgi:hypothetical protein